MTSPILLFAKLDDVLRFDGFVPGATFGVEELEQFLERFGIGGVAQERALALHVYESFVLQFLQVVRKSGVRNIQFGLDVANDQPLGMRREQQLHDAKTGFGAHRGKHVSVFRDVFRIVINYSGCHISIIAGIWLEVNLLDDLTGFRAEPVERHHHPGSGNKRC